MIAITPSPGGQVSGPPPPRHDPAALLEVALASDLTLLAEAVGAALESRQVRVRLLTWPQVPRDDPVQRQLARLQPDVAIVLYDVDMSIRMAEASALIRAWGGPWVVLTGTAEGPAWGGLREAGAAAVRASGTGLDDLEELVRLLGSGGCAADASSLDDYVARWRDAQASHEDVQKRINRLTPRERQVLDLLRRGVRVKPIAFQLGLSEATVRSQVRAVLRKLGVRSQLAAVALLSSIDGEA